MYRSVHITCVECLGAKTLSVIFNFDKKLPQYNIEGLFYGTIGELGNLLCKDMLLVPQKNFTSLCDICLVPNIQLPLFIYNFLQYSFLFDYLPF